MKTFRTEIKELYIDYFNNWITVQRFAEHHEMAYEDMEKIIEIGKLYHNADTDNTYNNTYLNLKENRKNGLSLSDIETAIYNGYTVYWKNKGYEVIKDKIGQYLIKCKANSYCVGLTRSDGTLIEKPQDFFLGLEN
tara:strand:- start:396 stop:803 length:408 start_codon:yes stop_codon:yes gene_type:complete